MGSITATPPTGICFLGSFLSCSASLSLAPWAAALADSRDSCSWPGRSSLGVRRVGGPARVCLLLSSERAGLSLGGKPRVWEEKRLLLRVRSKWGGGRSMRELAWRVWYWVRPE
uniref:Putative secreted protein n=1 Tax=Ixodes ricinus TaxID=34613 RepID=A0A6B0UKL8_IXORI